jgi:hypothetical protein
MELEGSLTSSQKSLAKLYWDFFASFKKIMGMCEITGQHELCNKKLAQTPHNLCQGMQFKIWNRQIFPI